MKALKDMKEGRVTAESKQLAQVNRAVTNKAGGATPPNKSLGDASALTENVEIKEREMPDHLFAVGNNNNRGGDKAPVDESLIKGLMEGKVRQGVPQVQGSPQPQSQKIDALTAANQLMESMEPKRQAINETNSKDILREVVTNLRRGGILKEEIIKVVLEEAMTETVLVPLMEKHFKRMLKEFLQERKKA